VIRQTLLQLAEARKKHTAALHGVGPTCSSGCGAAPSERGMLFRSADS
jgi:hypothetical protein